jgi:hypothetical protein
VLGHNKKYTFKIYIYIYIYITWSRETCQQKGVLHVPVVGRREKREQEMGSRRLNLILATSPDPTENPLT